MYVYSLVLAHINPATHLLICISCHHLQPCMSNIAPLCFYQLFHLWLGMPSGDIWHFPNALQYVLMCPRTPRISKFPIFHAEFLWPMHGPCHTVHDIKHTSLPGDNIISAEPSWFGLYAPPCVSGGPWCTLTNVFMHYSITFSYSYLIMVTNIPP